MANIRRGDRQNPEYVAPNNPPMQAAKIETLTVRLTIDPVVSRSLEISGIVGKNEPETKTRIKHYKALTFTQHKLSLTR